MHWVKNHDNKIKQRYTITGSLRVTGSLSKGSGSFLIDHPLDPLNKKLYHSFVESTDMKNIYDGIANCASDSVIVGLPDYFMALNRDYRHLLTAINEPLPNLFIKKEVHNIGTEETPKIIFEI